MNGDFEKRLRDGLARDLSQVLVEGDWGSLERRLRRRRGGRLVPAFATLALMGLAIVAAPRFLGDGTRRVEVGSGRDQDYDGWRVCDGSDHGGSIVSMVEDERLAAPSPREAVERHFAAGGYSRLGELDYVEDGAQGFSVRDGDQVVVHVGVSKDERGLWWVSSLTGCPSVASDDPAAAIAPRSVPVRESTAGLIAAATEPGSRAIVLVEASTGRRVYELPGWQERELRPLAFSPDGSRLLYSVGTGPPTEWRVVDFGRGTDAALPAGVASSRPPVWEGPDALLVPQDASVGVVDTRTMQVRSLDITVDPGQSIGGIAAQDGYRFALTVPRPDPDAAPPGGGRPVTANIASPGSDTFRRSSPPHGVHTCENPVFYEPSSMVALVCLPEDPVPYRTTAWFVRLATGAWTRALTSDEVEGTGHIVSFRRASDGGWLIGWSGECEVPSVMQIGRAALPLRRLFPDLAATTFGSYSPGGGQMVVEAADDCGGSPRVIVARADGSGRRDLGAYRTPLWSPAR
ncbi:MAG: hypothetical protein ACRDJO_07995 [Actinomycetota bacterium]